MYKVINNLKIYQSEKFESIFIEMINLNNRNTTIRCVWHHPSMEVNWFNNLFLNTISENLLSKKNKEIVLLGDFNVDLLKYKKDHNAADFLNQMYSTSLVPHIILSTRIIARYIYSADISENAISANCNINLWSLSPISISANWSI